MTTSEQINELAAALAKAQGEMGGAVKDSANPFFKSKYADLASVREACRPLAKHGIAVVQSPSAEGAVISVETTLMHTSGQWIRGVATATAKDDSPQAVGSVITYLRRYALQSFAGVAPEDDDAEAGQGRGKAPIAKPAAVQMAPSGYEQWVENMREDSMEGTERLQASWKKSSAEYRQYLTATNPKAWESMKAVAASVQVSA